MKTKNQIDILELKREEMQEHFSGHIDFSEKGIHSLVPAELLSKEKKVTNKELYQTALETLQSLTKLEKVEEIIEVLEKRENSPEERKNLRILKRFH